MFFGTIGGIVSGLSQPFFSVLFGNMLNALNSGNSLTEQVNLVVIDFLYVAAANIVVGFLQVSIKESLFKFMKLFYMISLRFTAGQKQESAKFKSFERNM